LENKAEAFDQGPRAEDRRVRQRRKNAKAPFDLDAAVQASGGDPKKFRAAVLKEFTPGDLGKLLEKTPLLKKAIHELEDKADEQGALPAQPRGSLHQHSPAQISRRLPEKAWCRRHQRQDHLGPGRVDAFGSARAFLFQDGYAPVNAVSYPFIWGLYRLEWFHYDNNTTSILQRNCGQALGVGAVYDPKTLASSLRPANLYRLEVLATKFEAARLAEEVFGPIDPISAMRGEAHFTKYCVACHKTPEGKEIFKDVVYDLDKLGTDPERAKMFAEKLPDGTPFPKAIGDAMDNVLKKALLDNNTSEETRVLYSKAPGGTKPVVVIWRGLGKYAARAAQRRLGFRSVPAQWLGPHDRRSASTPAKKRPPTSLRRQARLRSRTPRLPLHTSTWRQGQFDTSTPGNRNTGHEYGTDLKDDERKDLLEYLKTL